MWKRLLGLVRSPARVPVVLYTRAGCHLCDAMKAELLRARSPVPFDLSEVDIDAHAELVERYGRSIPVLEIAGRPAFKGRLTAAAFAKKLAERAHRAGGS